MSIHLLSDRVTEQGIAAGEPAAVAGADVIYRASQGPVRGSFSLTVWHISLHVTVKQEQKRGGG